MALTQTLAEMRDQILDLADFDASDFATTAELDRQINKAGRRLHGKLAKLAGSQYGRTVTTQSVTAGQANHGLPTDLLDLIAIDVEIAGRYYPAEAIDFSRRLDFQDAGGWSGRLVRYAWVKTATDDPYVEFFPTPDKAYTIRVHYVKEWTELVNDADTYNGVSGFEEWIIYTVAIYLGTREETDVTPLLSERALIEAEIIDAVPRRKGPRKPRNTRGWRYGRRHVLIDGWSE